jgi:hypothetical protein
MLSKSMVFFDNQNGLNEVVWILSGRNIVICNYTYCFLSSEHELVSL